MIKNVLILFLMLTLLPSYVFAYCYSLDPTTYNACIQKENQHNQMMQMQQQQLYMQQQYLMQQKKFQQQQIDVQREMLDAQKKSYQQISDTQQLNSSESQQNYFSGNLDYDYYQYMRKYARNKAPYMSKEEFAKVYNYR